MQNTKRLQYKPNFGHGLGTLCRTLQESIIATVVFFFTLCDFWNTTTQTSWSDIFNEHVTVKGESPSTFTSLRLSDPHLLMNSNVCFAVSNRYLCTENGAQWLVAPTWRNSQTFFVLRSIKHLRSRSTSLESRCCSEYRRLDLDKHENHNVCQRQVISVSNMFRF